MQNSGNITQFEWWIFLKLVQQKSFLARERERCYYLFFFSSFSKEPKMCFYYFFIVSCTHPCIDWNKKIEYILFLECFGLILELCPRICSQGLSRNSDCRGASMERLHSRFKWCCELGWTAHKYTMVFWGQYHLLIQRPIFIL